MRVAVLSGKGGTGKTFVATNLAYTINNCTYVDCDVEEPNGKLFFNSKNEKTTKVFRQIPEFDVKRCNGCRKCIEHCHFNALMYILNRPFVFNEVCHACGLCQLVCPNQAITLKNEEIGLVNESHYENINVVEGRLHLGQMSGVKVIETAKEIGFKSSQDTIVDCPPGSGCSVIETLKDIDYCLIVTEATSFSFENFKLIIDLLEVLKLPCGVIINKFVEDYDPLINYCKQHHLSIIAKIPYSESSAKLSSDGLIATKYDASLKQIFNEIYEVIR